MKNIPVYARFIHLYFVNRLALLFVFMTFTGIILTAQNIVHVNANATGENDGTSWIDAYTNLKTAITSTSSGQIWVAAGRYTPGNTRSDAFSLKNNVELYGGFTGTETTLDQRDYNNNETILSGSIKNNSDNCYHVIYNNSALNNTAIIDGFTIKDGDATRSDADGKGGGMCYTNSGSPTVRNCTFNNNSANDGGGAIYNASNSNPVIVNCIFIENNSSSSGSAVLMTGSSPVFRNCLFADNTTSAGGIIKTFSSSVPEFENCTFANNTAQSNGCALHAYSSPTFKNCILWGNSSDSQEVIIAIDNAEPEFYYCNIEGGKEGFSGGGSDSYSFNYESNNNINSEPYFVDESNNDYSLKMKSPCINAGNSDIVSTTETDLAGNTRILDGEIETGAYETKNYAPTGMSISTTKMEENLELGTVVALFTTTDPNDDDMHIYTFVSGNGTNDADNDAFTINGDSLKINTELDIETGQTFFSIYIQSTDNGGESVYQDFTLTVVDVNDAPERITLSSKSINENKVIGTAVGNFNTIDQDDDSHTYSFLSLDGNSFDNESFTIDNSILKSNEIFNFEVKNSYVIYVKSEDSGGESISSIFSITVDNVNDTPSDILLSEYQILETTEPASLVGTLVTIDDDSDDSHEYTLVENTENSEIGQHNGFFTISGSVLYTASTLDYDVNPTLSVYIRTTDSGSKYFEKEITIELIAVSQPPVGIELSENHVTENASLNDITGEFTTLDPNAEDSHTYSLIADGENNYDNDLFAISDNQLLVNSALDYETQSFLKIYVQTMDTAGATFSAIFSITVDDANDSPTDILLSAYTVEDSISAGSYVADLSAVDQDDAGLYTFELVAFGDNEFENGYFTIVDGILYTNQQISQSVTNTCTIYVKVTDQGGLTFSREIDIVVHESNIAPTLISLSVTEIDEDIAIGTIVGELSAEDPNDWDTFIYTFHEGSNDNENFTIDGNNLLSATTFDYETKPTYNIGITTEDSGGNTYTQTITIYLKNVNEAPEVANEIPDQTAYLNKAFIYKIPETTFVDEDANDEINYTATLNDGSDLPSWLTFSDTTLSGVPTETGSLIIKVTATDKNTLTASDMFILNILENNIISDVSYYEFSVWPVPVTDFLNINCNISGNTEIRIINESGKIILRDEVTGFPATVDLSKLTTGFYTLTIQTGDARVGSKILKQ